MEQFDVFHRLRINQQKFEHFPIQSLAIFGSVARNEARLDSDVDILVEFRPDAQIGLFEFVRLQRLLSDILGAPVDLVTPAALRKEMREQILAEAIPVA
ncbi:MAG: nucleotidyltransferase family protein [Chloroflexi bacterium]|nr:nucleotidyltransferase family protein [Chloroflexota bacterium]